MIPAGLAAVHVAVHAWRASIGTIGPTSLAAMDDETLGATYQATAALLRDVEEVHGQARELLVRRLMATRTAGS